VITSEIQAAKSTFCQLVNDDAHKAIIDLLVSLRSRLALSTDDVGWALWNICDRYAILRNAKQQYVYQSEFYEWGKTTLPALRLHWVVSDGTQALTLIDGGFLDFWWNCYQFANKRVPIAAENRTVRFESHRANAAAYTHFREFSRAESALQLLETVLSEDQIWVNRDFAIVTYHTLLVEFYDALEQREQVSRQIDNLDIYLGDWLSRFKLPKVMSAEPILGSWDQLNAGRPAETIFVAIDNAACAFAIAKQFVGAERLFRICLDQCPERMTAYCKALYLLACWQNRRSPDEIRSLLHGFQNLTVQQVIKFAPELKDVI